jgi:hypothetical protein
MERMMNDKSGGGIVVYERTRERARCKRAIMMGVELARQDYAHVSRPARRWGEELQVAEGCHVEEEMAVTCRVASYNDNDHLAVDVKMTRTKFNRVPI